MLQHDCPLASSSSGKCPLPQPQPGEVLVKIMKIGVCGSDIHVHHGGAPLHQVPHHPGARGPGEIAALGEGSLGLPWGCRW